MDSIAKLVGDGAAAVLAVLGVLVAVQKAVRAAVRWRNERRLERECQALLQMNPNGPGVVFHIEPEDLEAARWGESRGLLGVARSFDGWSIFRK